MNLGDEEGEKHWSSESSVTPRSGVSVISVSISPYADQQLRLLIKNEEELICMRLHA